MAWALLSLTTTILYTTQAIEMLFGKVTQLHVLKDSNRLGYKFES